MSDKMMALSLRPPYAEQVLSGEKTVEYRTVATTKRERVWVYETRTDGGGGLILGTVEITACREVRPDEFEWELRRPERLTEPLIPKGHPQPVFFDPFPEGLETFATADEKLKAEARARAAKAELETLRADKRAALDEVNKLRDLLDHLVSVPAPVVYEIPPDEPSGETTATALWTASDWHVEEVVEPGTVNGLNAFNPDVAKARSEAFWRTECRLTEIIARDIPVRDVVLHLGGDFITNDIHEQESAEITAMRPIEALLYAQDLIASGVAHALDRFGKDRRLTVVCSTGNHGRTTKRPFYATEQGHSIEHFMYSNLARRFPEATWINQAGYHTYLTIHGLTFRFHHGHRMSYWGGVGGITIPVRKAINEWNHAVKADVDSFGHFHQYLDGGNFIANGSLIGYNAFAVGIKARYEPPRQGFFVVDSKRGRTWGCPVVLK